MAGFSQSVKPVNARIAPSPTEPAASTIIGTVMVGGASCGWSCADQRALPWKVMKNSRDM